MLMTSENIFSIAADSIRTSTIQNQQFKVLINGENVQVQFISKYDVPIYYTHFVLKLSTTTKIEVISNQIIENYSISPLRRDIKGVKNGRKLTFEIDKEGYILVKINKLEDLYILIDRSVDYFVACKNSRLFNISSFNVDTSGTVIETKKIQQAIDETAKEKGVLYFPRGKYRTGELNFHSNMTVVLNDNALIIGSVDPKDYKDQTLIYLDSINHFKLLGFGTIDGSGWAGLRENGGKNIHLIYASNCNQITIDGLILRDPAFWNTRIFRSKNVKLKNIKILNNCPKENWTNTDGVDFDSSIHCSLVNALLYTGDDNMIVKGLDNKRIYPSENILFDRIITISNSAAAKIGTETRVKYFRNITFKNIDIIRCKRAMVIDAFDSTAIRNIKFINFAIENFTYQGSEKPYLTDFEITNNSWRKSAGFCTIKKVEISNIKLYCNMNQIFSRIMGRTPKYSVDGIKLSNISVNTLPISDTKQINLQINAFTYNVKLK
jgi:polygalacturonase